MRGRESYRYKDERRIRKADMEKSSDKETSGLSEAFRRMDMIPIASFVGGLRKSRSSYIKRWLAYLQLQNDMQFT